MHSSSSATAAKRFSWATRATRNSPISSPEQVLVDDNPPTRDQGTDRPGRVYFSAGSDRRTAVEATDWHQIEERRFADLGVVHNVRASLEDHANAFSTALDYVRELFAGAPTQFECASAATRVEAVRAGVGLGVVHGFIARRFKDLVRVLPDRSAARAYWLVTHRLGRIKALTEHLARAVARDKALFL